MDDPKNGGRNISAMREVADKFVTFKPMKKKKINPMLMRLYRKIEPFNKVGTFQKQLPEM